MISRLAAVLLFSACTPAVPPDPPLVEEMELTPAIGDHVLVLGTRGAAEPGLDVIGFSLEGTSEPSPGFVSADGSFLLEVPGFEGDVLRIQTEEAGLRSTPLDVVAGFGAAIAWTPALPCLSAPSAIDLAGATSATIAIANDCDEALTITAALRAPAPLELDPASATIQPGDTLEIELTRAGGPVDAVVLVSVTSPIADRRAISVLAR